MAITYPLFIPKKPGFLDIQWQPQSAVVVQQSPFTGQQQVYVWDGQWRIVTISLPPMTIETAREWEAFFHLLNGAEGTFYLQDSVGKLSVGNTSGAGLINGANQTGNQLITDGWTPNVRKLFNAGDWLSISSRLYKVLFTVDSDSGGNATLTLWPKIITAYADNQAICFGSGAFGIFRLKEFPENGWDTDRLMSGVKITATEVVP